MRRAARAGPEAAGADRGGDRCGRWCRHAASAGQIVANTRPSDYSRLARPLGADRLTRNGLPQAMQLVGRPFREDLLFRVGAAYEAAAGPFARPSL